MYDGALGIKNFDAKQKEKPKEVRQQPARDLKQHREKLDCNKKKNNLRPFDNAVKKPVNARVGFISHSNTIITQ